MRLAQELLGCTLSYRECSGLIIETEAYREIGDAACHLFYRKGARAFAREHQEGALYIYLNYGIHWLLNILTKDEKTGESGFILIRAIEPLEGLAEMKKRRNRERLQELCSGPAKLTQAMGMGPELHGASLTWDRDGVAITREPGADMNHCNIVADRRIGITKDADKLWRFLLKDHRGVSVKASQYAQLVGDRSPSLRRDRL